MNRLLPAALLFCAAAFLANPAWSFQGFDLFAQIQHAIECSRKPGTDHLVCGSKTQDVEEDPEEVATETEPVNPDLLSQEIIDPPRAKSPEMDFVWAEGTKFEIDLGVVEDNLKFGDECAVLHTEVFPENINDDAHQDFMIQMECQIDELYQGKSVKDHWKGGYIAESSIIFVCGSDEGLYNCTQEFTGHKDILAMAPDSWPGTFVYGNSATLLDVNGDGVKDIFMWTHQDSPSKANWWLDDITGSEPFFDRYYDLWGKPYEPCEFRHQYDSYTCWKLFSVQTYAISTPNGHVVKELEWPGQFLATGGWEIYKKGPDEFHINFDAQYDGASTWFTWNSETEEFDFVVSHIDGQENLEKYRPVDITKDWNTADTIARGGEAGIQTDWVTHNNVEYKVQERDFSKTVSVYGDSDTHAQCESIIGFDYDVCERDELYIVSKTDQGVETFIEYRPQEIATDVRTSRMYGNPGTWYSDYIAIQIHGYWVVYNSEMRVSGQIVQLEDRPDADWYFIVSYSAQTDMWAPGEHYVSDLTSEYIDEECRPGADCLYNESDIAFKYKIDFENQTLEYQGTLFEYPFIWRAVGADRYEFRDANDDGWKDVVIKHGRLNLWHVSNIYGELQLLDLQTILPQGFFAEDSDNWVDFDGDGNDDLVRIENKDQTDSLNVYKTAENLWDVTPILTPWEIQDRIDNCVTGEYIPRSGRASECYDKNQ